MNILVTGGAGFIGSNFIRYLLENDIVEEVINYDKKTYAGKGKNIEHMGLDKDPRYRFIYGDICNKSAVQSFFGQYNIDLIFNFAAESHVDKSIIDKNPFRKTNIVGTGILLEASRRNNILKFIHISTDEVYGSIKDGSFKEDDETNPSNPYAKTKADAEVLAQHYYEVCGVPIIITRSANNYGPYQFPEKLLPLFITNLIDGKRVPLMWSEENPGLNVRDWLHVEDNCRAIFYISQKGNVGEVYNIPGENIRTNIEMTKILLDYFGYGEEMIEKVPHRKAHDFRYSIDGSKLEELGFKYNHKNLEGGLENLCKWYKNNENWWRPLKK